MSENSFECLITDVEICFDKLLGKGSYAEVFVATYHGAKVAAKRLDSRFFESVNPEEHKGFSQSFLKELRIMNSLKHPNIVPFYGVFNSDNPTSLLPNVNSYIITELLTKSLQAKNLEKPRLTVKNIVDIAIDIAAGLCYLHNHRQEPIMHGSLASRKVLLGVSGQAKIADIGVAKLQSHNTHCLSLDCYSPSEKMFNDVYDHSADVYALGVIILEMAIGKDPTATQFFKRVGNGLEIVPESERRRSDFTELQTGPNVMLENVIMLCLQEKGVRALANKVAIHLDKLKSSEAYRSCAVSLSNEIKKITDTDNIPLEHHHDLKEIKLEIERLKNKTQTLEEKLHTLEHSNTQLQSKSTQYEKQILTLMAERGLTNITPQMQQTAQYVLSESSQQLPHQMSSSLSMPRYMPGALEKPRSQLLNYNFDQRPSSLYSLNQPSTSLHITDQPLRSSHISPSLLLNFNQPPTSFHKFDKPLRSSHNFDQPPLQHQQRSLSGTSIYNHENFPDKDSSPLLLRRYSLPIIPIIQKEKEYLSYQLSCMERVILQLESATSNTSEKLIISFMDTLKEQIIKTGDYIAKLPIHIKTGHYLHELLQKIHQTVSYAPFNKIPPNCTEGLDTAIKYFQHALAKTIN